VRIGLVTPFVSRARHRAAGAPDTVTVAVRAELPVLTGLRMVAAAWVVLFHLHFTPLPGVAAAVRMLGPLVTAGALGVDLFFVLSGFVIAYTYLDRLGPRLRVDTTLRYLWARASRLWPLYALVFHVFGIWMLARLIVGPGTEVAFQAVQPVLGPGEWLEQVFMVQMWTSPFLDGASWVGPTWSISAEWLAYLLFPLAAPLFFRMRGLPIALLVAAALALMAPHAGAYLLLGTPYYPWSWAVRILCGFGAGVLTYLAVRRLDSSARTRRAASALAVVAPLAIAAGLLTGERVVPGSGGVVIVLFPLLVGALAVADRGPAMVLSSPRAVRGGHLSYALYLVHIPMFEVYWLALRMVGWLGPDTLLAHLAGLAVAIATVPVAALAYRLVEEPARRRMRAMVPAAPPAGGGPARGLAFGAGRGPSGSPGPRHAVARGRQASMVSALISTRDHDPAGA
jgi:peptidoglycan/LPS O-acetylase OafA/YrhL